MLRPQVYFDAALTGTSFGCLRGVFQYLPDPLATTAGNFPTVREVSADKGYSSKTNANAIEKEGAMPLIPFKSNAVEPPADSARGRMYHQFAYNRDDFLTHYHRRSNVETVFAMVKAKFAGNLMSKSPEGQTNEALSKFVAHNRCVLIQAFYELGIESTFDATSAPGQRLALKGMAN